MKDAVALTKELVALPTVTGEILHTQTNRVMDLLHERGYAVTRHAADGEHILATRGNGNFHLAFVSHYDVVPAGKGWKRDAFTAPDENGVLYGRGVSDMKGGLAAQIVAGNVLADLGARISLFIAADEETGSKGMPLLLDVCKDPITYAIGGEPTGIEKSGDVVKMGRRGVVQGIATIHGQQGHAAYPEKTRNILHNLADVISSFTTPVDEQTGDFPRSICSITGVNANAGRYNIIPASIDVQFDARLNPETTPQMFVSRVGESLAKHGIKVDFTIKKTTPAYQTIDALLRSRVESSIEAVLGKKPMFSTDGGASDMRFFAQKGIPCVEIGLPNGNIHGADEYVKAVEINRLVDIYVALGKSLLQK